MQNKFLSKDDLHLVHPKFRDNVIDAWLHGEEVPEAVTHLSGWEITQAEIKHCQEVIQKHNLDKNPIEELPGFSGKRIEISVKGENTSISLTVPKSPENDNDWADILEEVVRSLRTPVVEDKELI